MKTLVFSIPFNQLETAFAVMSSYDAESYVHETAFCVETEKPSDEITNTLNKAGVNNTFKGGF